MASSLLIHDLNPIAFSVGGFSVYWYSLMYLVAFGLFWWLGSVRSQRPDSPLTAQQVGDLLFWGVIGVVLGGRLGYVLAYVPGELWRDPLLVLRIRDGGMSFHGGLLGVLVVLWAYGRHLGCGFLRLADFVAPLVPLGLAAGRLGNFIGGELYGRVTDVPWAMVFSSASDGLARHPSQLYQAGLEGLTLFIIVWLYSGRPRPVGAVGGVFLIGYGVLRSVGELFREPDAHLGFLLGGVLTMGQLLSLPMVLIGLGLLVRAQRQTLRK
jgi:phosphatidylglycerol:prolipoprotein diacylglycerol transferase